MGPKPVPGRQDQRGVLLLTKEQGNWWGEGSREPRAQWGREDLCLDGASVIGEV